MIQVWEILQWCCSAQKTLLSPHQSAYLSQEERWKWMPTPYWGSWSSRYSSWSTWNSCCSTADSNDSTRPDSKSDPDSTSSNWTSSSWKRSNCSRKCSWNFARTLARSFQTWAVLVRCCSPCCCSSSPQAACNSSRCSWSGSCRARTGSRAVAGSRMTPPEGRNLLLDPLSKKKILIS